MTRLQHIAAALAVIDAGDIERIVAGLVQVKQRHGRVFVIGAGGSAAIASHAVIDLRKAGGIDAHAPTDGVEELTARTNDEGWESAFAGYLRVSRICADDALLIFSIGGGDAERGTSLGIVAAIDAARASGAAVFGVVANASGYTARQADAHVLLAGIDGPINLAAMGAVQKVITTHPALVA